MNNQLEQFLWKASLLAVAAMTTGCTDGDNQTGSQSPPKRQAPLDPSLIVIANDPKGLGRYVITQSVCDAQPRWNPEKGALPISIQELVKIAIDSQLSDELPPREHWRANNVEFNRFPASWVSSKGASFPNDRINRWSVKIKLRYNPDYNSDRDWWNEYCYVYLLLDGTLVDFIPNES